MYVYIHIVLLGGVCYHKSSTNTPTLHAGGAGATGCGGHGARGGIRFVITENSQQDYVDTYIYRRLADIQGTYKLM